MPWKRLMLTIDRRRCPFGCVYCFDRFAQYSRVPSLVDVAADPAMLDGVHVVYPACDVDLFARRDYKSILNQCVGFSRHVSVSTKAVITEAVASEVGRRAAEMRRAGLTLKVGVSLSTQSRCRELEPRTSPYLTRLESLRKLRAHGVNTSLNIKPILAEVPDSEYRSILGDCAQLTDHLLIGDEWLDEASVSAAAPTTTRARVDWLPEQPSWPVMRDVKRRLEISRMAEQQGFHVHDSDLDLMQHLAGVR